MGETQAVQGTTTADLAQALAAVAGGDRGAFERVYTATSAKLFGVCLRVLPDRDEAEDVLQEVYATVWRKAGQFDASRASPITWLAMIARNKAIDRLAGVGGRGRGRERALGALHGAARSAPPLADPHCILRRRHV